VLDFVNSLWSCPQTLKSSSRNPKTQANPELPEAEPAIADGVVNIVSTWKVAIRPSQTTSPRTPSKAKTKKQPKMQPDTRESLNFLVAKVSTKNNFLSFLTGKVF
jgi:hypothetical protein